MGKTIRLIRFDEVFSPPWTVGVPSRLHCAARSSASELQTRRKELVTATVRAAPGLENEDRSAGSRTLARLQVGARCMNAHRNLWSTRRAPSISLPDRHRWQ